MFRDSDRLIEMSKFLLDKVEESKNDGLYFIFSDSEFEGYEHPRDHKYTLEEIHQRPNEIKRKACELYLSDEEFERVFKMNKEEFYQLKEWKRKNLKKETNLF
jgi:hypothetical protein